MMHSLVCFLRIRLLFILCLCASLLALPLFAGGVTDDNAEAPPVNAEDALEPEEATSTRTEERVENGTEDSTEEERSLSEGSARTETPTDEPSASLRTNYPLTLADANGTNVTIQEQPDTVASLTLFADEVLLNAISSNRITSITNLASDEVYSNVVELADNVRVQIDFNVEILLSIAPDIVFVASWSNEAKVEQLRRAGRTVFVLKTPSSIPEIQDEMRTIGRIVNAQEEVEAILRTMDETLATVSRALEALPPEEMRTVLDYNSWGLANSSATTWNSIVEAAGSRNAAVLADATANEPDEFGQIFLSREYLLELDPYALFIPDWIWGDPQGANAFEEQIRSDPALALLSAVQNDRVYRLAERLKTTYSHYIADAVRAVAELVYPEYF